MENYTTQTLFSPEHPRNIFRDLRIRSDLAIEFVRFVSWTMLALIVRTPIRADAEQLEQPKSTEVAFGAIRPGLAIARYQLDSSSVFLNNEVFLIKIDPALVKLKIGTASDVGEKLSSVKAIAQHHKALVGINAHFFDLKGNPLGLLVREQKTENKLHAGGNTLTGIFVLDDKIPIITHRTATLPANLKLALQAGPRIIAAGRPVREAANSTASRRSGVAVTKSKEIILYATYVRFPGASIKQIQDMLLRPELEVTDALNLDGGGSSQLFIDKTSGIEEELLITGGDMVPTALLVID